MYRRRKQNASARNLPKATSDVEDRRPEAEASMVADPKKELVRSRKDTLPQLEANTIQAYIEFVDRLLKKKAVLQQELSGE